jgi:quercetin dioxygenase-like cupin family protein
MNAVVVRPGEGHFIAIGSGGAGVTVKTSTEATGGLCTVWEGQVAAGATGAGPHFHRGRDEFFYILDGELVLQIDDATHTVGAGTFVFVPRGVVHGFHNASAASARLLVMHHPAGFERYFEAMQELATSGASREERAALAARYDVVPRTAPARA